MGDVPNQLNKIVKDLSPSFGVVTALFFGWGLISANNEPLLTALKSVFQLNWTQALLTQIVGLLAGGLFAIPAAIFLNRFGSSRTIMFALMLMLLACFGLQLEFIVQIYWLILMMLFLMASGLSTLQVAANPLIAALGHEDLSHFRLTLAQTFNSLGVVIGVHFGTKLLLSPEILRISGQESSANFDFSNEVAKSNILNAVSNGFMVISFMVIALLLLIFINRKRIDDASQKLKTCSNYNVFHALKSKWAIFGAVSIGLYVGAEVSIASIMISFLGQDTILGLSLADGGRHLANFYWGGALLGRFIGTALLTKMRAPTLLMICAGVATILCLIVLNTHGAVAGYCALGVGLFNSVMFPIIFTMTLRRAAAPESAVSGLLCLAISGGAFLALIVGRLADMASLSFAFIVPVFAYSAIICFALLGARFPPKKPA